MRRVPHHWLRFIQQCEVYGVASAGLRLRAAYILFPDLMHSSLLRIGKSCLRTAAVKHLMPARMEPLWAKVVALLFLSVSGKHWPITTGSWQLYVVLR